MKRLLLLVLTLLLAAGVASAPLTTLLARYPLETDGRDVSGHSNALTVLGSPVFGPAGVTLNGSTQYLFRLSGLEDFGPFSTGVTFAARVKIAELTGAGINQHVIHWQGSGLAANIRLFYAGDRHRMVFAAAADSVPTQYPAVVWTAPPPVGEEVAVIGWADPENHRLGLQQGDAEPVIMPTPGLVQEACTGLWVGSKRDVALWRGTLRDVRIISGVWDAAQRHRYVTGP